MIERDDAYDLLEEHKDILTTLVALNAAESTNIARARAAAFASLPSLQEMMTRNYLLALHESMFDQVWSWAGQQRTRESNFGVAPQHIYESLEQVVGNGLWRLESTTEEEPQRHNVASLHSELVLVHPFKNGNGRHSRLFCDLVCERVGLSQPTYGVSLPSDPRDAREAREAREAFLAPSVTPRERYLAAVKHTVHNPYDTDDLVKVMWS